MKETTLMSRTKLMKFLLGNWGWVTGVVATFIFVNPIGMREYHVNGDGLYLIWSGLIQSESLFGFTKHLAWPEGYSNWQHPQLGLGYLLINSLVSLLSISNSASMIFGLTIVMISAANGICANLLLKSIDSNSAYLRNCLTFSLTFAPFLITNTHHLNVGAFYSPIVSLYLYFRLSAREQDSKLTWKEYVSLSIILTGVPWWQGSLALIFLTLAIGSVIMKSWSQFKAAALVFNANLVGFLLQTLPSIIFFKSNSLLTRSGWDSNYFGGHFADFLLASPLLNSVFPQAASRIQPGVSHEFNYSGILGLIGFFVILGSILSGKVTKFSYVGLIIVLFFTLGAFGNLQAALMELLGLKSPLRTWSRFVIIVALVGTIILFVSLQKRKRIGILFGTFVALFTVCEVLSVKPSWEFDLKEEKQVVRELKQRTQGNCVVLQLPLNSWPNPFVDELGRTDETFYSSGIFYTLDRSFYWTYGNWTLGNPRASDFNIEKISKAMLKIDPWETLNKEYCAILVDKLLLVNRAKDSFAPDVQLAKYLMAQGASYSGKRYSLFMQK